jgi:heterodisulfide reductase subunit A
MKIAVLFCACGDNVTGKIDLEVVRQGVLATPDVSSFCVVELLCSEGGQADFCRHLEETRPDRVVAAACSPRDHEATFRRCLERAGMNPYFLQVANIREQAAWVTADRGEATRKALKLIRAAARRSVLHQPLEVRKLDVSTDVMVLGAGPAGLAATLTLAEAGRKVTLVEKTPVLGGTPFRFEKVFPTLECGSCMIDPVLSKVMQSPTVEVHTLAQVTAVAGSYGNFLVTLEEQPRCVDTKTCIGCGMCVEACPVAVPNDLAAGVAPRKAMGFGLRGGLPNVPFLDPAACLRSRGEPCDLCEKACPVPGIVNLDDEVRRSEHRVGAIIVATGAALDDGPAVRDLGHGRVRDVRTTLEVEALTSRGCSENPGLLDAGGRPPRDIAFLHCAGSLDEHHPYCSGVCCAEAFKLSALLLEHDPGLKVTHYLRALCLPGKQGHVLRDRVRGGGGTEVFLAGGDRARVEAGGDGRPLVRWSAGRRSFDTVVLCPATVPAPGTAGLARLLDLGLDRHGFLEELHGRTAPVQSRIKGIFVAGNCQAPTDVGGAVAAGQAAAGNALAGLVPGRQLELDPVVAHVDEDRCSGCRTCVRACPYKAVSFDEGRGVAVVNAVLCAGCGTCVAGCPSGAMLGSHFGDQQLRAEIDEALA